MDTKSPLTTGYSGGQVHPVYPYGSPCQTVRFVAQPERQPTSSARRFLRAFVWAAVILFSLSFLHHSIHAAHWVHRSAGWFTDSKGWPSPSDGVIERCVESNDWLPDASPFSPTPYPYPFSGETSFDLPASADLLFLLSRGSLAHGSVRIVASDDDNRAVQVGVRVEYYAATALDRASVCLLRRGDDEHGIGIFTPQGWPHRSREDQLRFDITVRLPAGSDSSPLRISALDTDLRLFKHEVDDLIDKVSFGTLSLKTDNSPITVQSAYAEHGSFTTVNAPIEGSFNTSHSLALITANARIVADVGLQHQGEDDNTPTNLLLKTSNAFLNAAVSLQRSGSSTGGSYKVTARTSNSPLHLTFPASPPESLLHTSARTSNAPARVALHAAYEGEFSAQSSLFSPVVEQSENVEDPKNEGRQRHVDVRKIGRGRSVKGQVWWGDNGEDRGGDVQVKTSNARAVLEL